MPSKWSISSHWHNIYKGTVLSPDKPNKIYLGTCGGGFKKQFYNHRELLNNEAGPNDTNLSKYIWEHGDIILNRSNNW